MKRRGETLGEMPNHTFLMLSAMAKIKHMKDYKTEFSRADRL